MIRLLVPLVVSTAIIWALLFGFPKVLKRKSTSAAKGFLISFALAVLVVVVVSAAFYLGGLVNEH